MDSLLILYCNVVTIAASSGLNDSEIENMVKEAEANAESDRLRRETIEMANRAESMISDTEKALDDFKDQLDSTEAEKVKQEINNLRAEVVKAGENNTSPEDLKSKIDQLQNSSLKLFEMVYKKRAQDNNNPQDQ